MKQRLHVTAIYFDRETAGVVSGTPDRPHTRGCIYNRITSKQLQRLLRIWQATSKEVSPSGNFVIKAEEVPV